MATLGSNSNTSSPSRRRSNKSCVRRCERACWSFLSSFPLAFVYGLTTWAVWVQAHLGFAGPKGAWTGPGFAFLGIALWALLNWSYTVAVFTDPGSPLSDRTHKYSSLPSHEPAPNSLTVKSTGEHRFCKKCQTRKPDRAHHCSSCKRCVLKMDHHCPWLATCVGFRNYKPFVLFLVYTCLFCDACFLATASWIWVEFLNGGADAEESVMPIQYVLLCVLSGIIGLVLSGFTGWHMYLATQGQTTIESLEKTRYLTPIRKSMQHQPERQYVGEDDQPSSPRLIDQVVEAHANALPGVTRPEEGEDQRESPVTARQSLHRNYSEIEAQRERDRYAAYLDELDSEKMPNAFDHGWKTNMRHVFGESPLLWVFPVCNTTGDGWNWPASAKWHEARADLARERQARERENQAFQQEEQPGWAQRTPLVDFRGANPPQQSRFGSSAPNSEHSMRSLSARGPSTKPDEAQDDYDSSDDSDDDHNNARRQLLSGRGNAQERQWNDLPEDMIAPGASSRAGALRSPRPARAYPDG